MSPAGFRCRRRRRPDAPGTVAEMVAYRLAGERAVREREAGAAGTGTPGELLAWQQKRQAQLALEYVAKVAHIRGTTQRDALEAERVLRAAEVQESTGRVLATLRAAGVEVDT